MQESDSSDASFQAGPDEISVTESKISFIHSEPAQGRDTEYIQDAEKAQNE